jgi:acylphosphatase
MNRRLEATVRGQVQGVGYRFFVIRLAGRLSLSGWVANMPDGSVRVVAEGTAEQLAELLAGLQVGPPGALVSSVDESWPAASGSFSGFGVRTYAHGGD